MNMDPKTRKIEARLERSLRSQVLPPKLDGRFDASVWSRIAAEESKASPVRKATRMPGWLVASNIVGAVVIVLLMVIFASRSVTGVEVDVGFDVPAISAQQRAAILQYVGPAISAAAVLFGLMYTRMGRRLISTLR